jgi:predicted dehydrogenase
VLGADGHFYRRQMEAFADRVLTGAETGAAFVEDGLASVRGMAAVARSAETGRPVRLADVAGAV